MLGAEVIKGGHQQRRRTLEGKGERNFLLCFLPWWCCVRRVGYAVRETREVGWCGGKGKAAFLGWFAWLEQLLI
jgi:hypothetical protein